MTLTAADRIGIHELCARLYLAIDSGDAPGFAQAFAADGVMIAPNGNVAGTDELRRFMQRYIETERRDGDWHFVTNQMIEPHLAGARYRFSVAKFNASGGAVAMAPALGDCLLRKGEDGWRFQRFQLMVR